MDALQALVGFSIYAATMAALIYVVRSIGRIANAVERVASRLEGNDTKANSKLEELFSGSSHSP